MINGNMNAMDMEENFKNIKVVRMQQFKKLNKQLKVKKIIIWLAYQQGKLFQKLGKRRHLSAQLMNLVLVSQRQCSRLQQLNL